MYHEKLSTYHKVTLYGIEKPMRERYPAWYEYKKQLWERGRFLREHKKRNTGKPKIRFITKRTEPKAKEGVTMTWRAK